MLPYLPSEILDLIVDHLYDNPTTLKACALASKSWIPRTRRHLFAHIEFGSAGCHIRLWMKAFPDPSNSPACYTRSLRFSDPSTIAAASTVAIAWVSHFCYIVELRVDAISPVPQNPVSLVQLCGLSPTLRFLHLSSLSTAISEVLGLICSFPLLEDLRLCFVTTTSDTDGVDTLPTPPRLIGTLSIVAIDQTDALTRGLLSLPGGLHFTRLTVACLTQGSKSVNDLVSRCSDTLKSITITYNPIGGFTPVSVADRHSPFAAYRQPPPLILSSAIRLRNVKFRFLGPSVRWIITTFQTAKTTSLRQITITIVLYSVSTRAFGETICREWQDLDHLLDELWTSSSVRSKIAFETREGNNHHLRKRALILLPRLMSKGAVKLRADQQ